MFEDIKKNKRKTSFIVFLFVLMIAAISYTVSMWLQLGAVSIVIALVISFITAYASYYNCDKIVLSLSKARPATPEEDIKLLNILDGLMISSGLPSKPKVYVIEDGSPNAFATGRNPENSVICVTTGLLGKLNYYELEAVVAHELSHIKNYDILLSTVITVMVGFILILSDIFTRSMFWGGGKSRNNDDNKGSGIFMVIGLVLLILSPIFAQIIQFSVSRKREFLADASAIELTRNPDALISALSKLEEDTDPLEVANTSTAHMYIVNPLNKMDKKKKKNLFSTHPEIQDRIEAIRNLK